MKYIIQNTIELFQEKGNLQFLFFWGYTIKNEISKACFSQWFPASFKENSIEYRTAEHYMMAEKARLFNDDETMLKILESGNPKEAKSLGREIKNFDHQTWDNHKYEIVKKGNFLKFSQNSEFREFLLSTEDKVIVEASPYDTIWGIGMSESDSKAENPSQWRGENLLGFALMEVRDELRR